MPIPAFGANGAAIGSVACHMVAFTIAFNVLRKNVKLNLTFKKFVLKPLMATIIMSVCSYFIYIVLKGIIIERLATIIAMIVAVVIYGLSILALRILNKEDIYMIPYGQKIYKILEKLGIYREAKHAK